MNRVLAGVGLISASALVLLLVGASADHWHLADDLTNLRWALEYRAEPWRALTERHSVHDHVRPLTLIGTWVGAWISDGAWWGVRAVNVGLLLGGLLGAAALAGRLGGPGAGLLAALLVLVLPGFADLPWWNAWMCSAGELCCGLWALVAADQALARGRPPLLALTLLVAAGLFKEPGWLVALPLLGLALRHRRWGWAGVVLAVAAAGVAYTWHPANLVRAEAVPGSWLTRIDRHLAQVAWREPGAWAQDPGWPLRAALLWALLVVAALPPGRWRWGLGLGLPLALLLGGAAGGPSVGWAPLLLVLVAVARTWRAPPPGLWLLVATWLPILPYPGTNAVQQLTGAVGLVVFLASRAEGRLRVAAGALAVLAALVAGWGRPPPAMVAGVEDTRARRALVLGIAAVSQELGARQLVGLSDDIDTRTVLNLAPLWGATRRPEHEQQPVHGTQVGEVLVVGGPRPLVEGDLLGEVELPVARMRTDHPRPGRPERQTRLADVPGVELDLAPGRYLLGVLAHERRTDNGVAAVDGCGRAWQPANPQAGVDAVGVVVEVLPGCGPLKVRRTLHGEQQRGRPFLAALAQPRLHFRGAPPEQRILDVRVGPVKLDLGGPGGPRPPGI